MLNNSALNLSVSAWQSPTDTLFPVKSTTAIKKGFSGDGTPPKLTDDIRIYLAEQYMALYKKLTGNNFVPSIGEVKDRICSNLKAVDIK